MVEAARAAIDSTCKAPMFACIVKRASSNCQWGCSTSFDGLVNRCRYSWQEEMLEKIAMWKRQTRPLLTLVFSSMMVATSALAAEPPGPSAPQSGAAAPAKPSDAALEEARTRYKRGLELY